MTGSGSYRCRGVVFTGVAWLVGGAGLLVLAGLNYSQNPHILMGPALFLVILAVFALIIGLGLVTSRLTVGDTQLVWRWCYATYHLDLRDALDVTLAPPRSGLENQNGHPSGAAAAYYGGYFVIVGGTLRRLAILLSWAAVPGSGADQVLHVTTRYHGTIKIAPISCRLEIHPGDVVPALSAVQAAIERAHRA